MAEYGTLSLDAPSDDTTRRGSVWSAAQSEDVGRRAAALVSRILAGDRPAERELVEQFRPRLVTLLRRLTGDHALAEDLAQETLIAALERIRLKPLDEPTRLGAFLRGIARNLSIAHARLQARRRTKLAGDSIDDFAAVSGDPASIAEAAQEIELVRRLIGELNVARDRELLIRFYVDGEQKDQICADLNLDPLHFNRVLHRARARLRELRSRQERNC